MYVRSPEFIVRHSKTPNGAAHWKIVGYPNKKREVHWFHEKRTAAEDAARRNRQLKDLGRSLSLPEQYDAIRALKRLDGRASLTEATEFFLADLNRNVSNTRLADIVTDCIAINERKAKRGEISEAQIDNLRYAGKRIMKAFGDRAASTLDRAEIARWLNGLELSAASRDFYRRYMGTFFAYAIEQGHVKDNPVKGIKRSGEEGEIGILTVAQCRGLMTHAPEQMIPYYALGLFAGLRPQSEIARMNWSAIDWTDRLIEVRNWKTGRTRSARFRYVAMSRNLIAWLAPIKEPSGPLWGPPACWARMHLDTRKAAGIEIWAHDAMRHSYGSYLLSLTHDAGKVAGQMGHESARMIYRHYRKLVKPDEAKGFWEIFPVGYLESTPPSADSATPARYFELPSWE